MSRFAIIGSRGYPSFYGGFETLVRQLSPYLLACGHEVTVYGRDAAFLPRSEHRDGIEVRHTLGLDRKSLSTLSFGLSASLDARKRHYDGALVLNVANGPYLHILARAGIPTCVNVDGMEWIRGKWGRIARAAFMYGARQSAIHANQLVMDSRYLGQSWSDKFGRSGVFIPYGAPLLEDIGSDLLTKYGLSPSGYVLVVARIVPENNIDLLLDAIADSTDIPIVVVGSASYSHPTASRLRRLNTINRIHWLGHVVDQRLLDQLWSNAGVYWHGHSVGGTNPALLQALGAGAPTIALSTPFNREVLEREEHLVVPDPNLLKEAILQMIGSSEMRHRMATWGKSVVESRYSWNEVCASYERLLVALTDDECTMQRPRATSTRSRASRLERFGWNTPDWNRPWEGPK